MIAGIIACRNEAAIIEKTLRHHLAEELDRIYVSVGASNDGTAGIVERVSAETGKLEVRHDPDPIFHQAAVMNTLAMRAAADGAEWLVPFDADEFIYAVNGQPVAEVLADCPHNKLYCRAYVHNDWNTRHVDPKFWHKVVYRWMPGALLTMGQHDVSIPGGVGGVLAIRELQYQSYEHFIAKRDLWLSALAPADRARGDVSHYQRLEHMVDEELRREWDALMAISAVEDPIPTRAL